MEVGRQFDDPRPLPSFKTYHNTCRQTMRVAQLGIGNRSISVRYTDRHRLTGKIPGTVGLYTRSKGAQGEQQCTY